MDLTKVILRQHFAFMVMKFVKLVIPGTDSLNHCNEYRSIGETSVARFTNKLVLSKLLVRSIQTVKYMTYLSCALYLVRDEGEHKGNVCLVLTQGWLTLVFQR